MASWFFEPIMSKVGEIISGDAYNTVKNIINFEPNRKDLQKNLNALCAKASDVEEKIRNSERSGRKKRKREVEEWLEEVRSIENQVVELRTRVELEGFTIRLTDGELPAKLNVEVDKLVEQSRDFGELVLDVCGSRGDKLLTNEMVGEAFNKNLEKILKHLESEQVWRIGVYGMGGVGKTTLAKHINNRLLQQSQGRVIWVTVSQEFSVTTLQDKIARFISLDFGGEDNEELRAGRLHTTLSQMKNSVLILDDVWENIDLLKVGCPISVECCRLFITTRSLEVCRQISCQKLIPVQTLHRHEAWKLFNETLRNEIELDSSAEEIARSVVELCGGLPLAIVTVAGSMRGERAIHTWRNAYEELTERVSGKAGSTIYSFDRLERNRHGQTNELSTLQHCFLHCALYPEDEEIEREALVREFISGGLVDERKTRRMQVEQGHSILDKLVNVCLLESCVVPGRFDPTECVKMHDLVRGMALKICEGKYMVRGSGKWAKDLEKVSLMKGGIMRIEGGLSPDCPKLSTLILRDNACLEFIPDSFFSKMQGLSTLDLSQTSIKMLPNSICAMKSLKALLLKSCRRIKDVPYLGEMKELRELNISHTAIKEVPGGVGELFNLKFLALNVRNLKMLPKGLFLKLGNLQHLELPLRMQVVIEEIENLNLLEEVSGRFKNVNEFNSLITSWGSRVHDTCYTIVVGTYHRSFYARRGEYYNPQLLLSACNLVDERVLAEGIVHLTISKPESPSIYSVEGLKGLIEKPEIGALSTFVQPKFSSLTMLRIEKCNKSKMRIPLSGVLNIEVIDISKCEEIEEIFEDEGTSSLTLPKLKILWLDELPRLRKVGIQLSGVPSIQVISVRKCGEIKEIFGDKGTGSLTLSKLKYIQLDELPKLRKVGILLSGVPNLEDIYVRTCGEIEEIFGDEGSSSPTLPELKQLDLQQLPKLKSLCKGTNAIICNSIKDIFIKKCPRLMSKLPVVVDSAVPRRCQIMVAAVGGG
ncbi:probable disease resistance protein At4g27220 [Salvia hispanica]|uniref:probable disease resistance protein At4g27220 n=1 Tax=Salvia hispanica TaxID=49212 RepID=UPI002009044A|nr:probable disease resistance protein At4g27220 [Salvia hispanica]